MGILGLAPSGATASKVKLDVGLGQPVLLADQDQKTYLKISLTGFDLERPEERAPVNIAIVLDKSGSMSGEKIYRARDAARMAVDRLGDQDIVSVVVYDSTVRVIVPATKASDRENIHQAINRIEANGNTALFAGVSKGAAELRKFLDRERVNRVILLSDGLANVGPSTPSELGQLGHSLVRDGIAVTTIGLGLGYNEDLMTRLAYNSDGNHYFAESAHQLASIFDSELGDVLSVVAQEIVTEIECAPGIRPIRILGRDGEISGQHVKVYLNQLYSSHEKYVLVEVEVPSHEAGEELKLADVRVRYDNMKTRERDLLAQGINAQFTKSADEVRKQEDKKVMIAVVEQVATEKNEQATELRDQGQVEEAQQLLLDNAAYLERNARTYKAPQLESLGEQNRQDADAVEDEADWTRQRKVMREKQSEVKMQQRR
jgi:Ca-activated chloride channel family protein